MRRVFVTLTAIFAALLFTAGNAYAGNPHFTGVRFSTSGNTITVSGKEAGLGNETQVHIVITATATCTNRGNNQPKAENKTSVTAEGTFPVQNGKADFSLTATATFQPNCSPPMTVVFSNVVVSDAAHGISVTL